MEKINLFKIIGIRIQSWILAIIISLTLVATPQRARADFWGGDGVSRRTQV